MTYRGHVKNGQVVLDEAAPLPEGAEVSVAVVADEPGQPNLWDKLRSLAGTVEGPADWAQNHDRYAHGSKDRL